MIIPDEIYKERAKIFQRKDIFFKLLIGVFLLGFFIIPWISYKYKCWKFFLIVIFSFLSASFFVLVFTIESEIGFFIIYQVVLTIVASTVFLFVGYEANQIILEKEKKNQIS